MRGGVIVAFLLIFIRDMASGQPTSPADTFPIPSKNNNQLFYLQRQPNANTIIVDLNTRNGEIDWANPVHVYWRRYTERGQKAELSWIQKTFAYGMHTKKISPGEVELSFVSYRKMVFKLRAGPDRLWKVFANLRNGSPIILKRIYLHVNGGSFWKPNIEYVELTGNEPDTNKEVRERIQVK